MIEDSSIRNYARINLNSSILGKSDLSKFYKWIQITVANFIVADNLDLLAKLLLFTSLSRISYSNKVQYFNYYSPRISMPNSVYYIYSKRWPTFSIYNPFKF